MDSKKSHRSLAKEKTTRESGCGNCTHFGTEKGRLKQQVTSRRPDEVRLKVDVMGGGCNGARADNGSEGSVRSMTSRAQYVGGTKVV